MSSRKKFAPRSPRSAPGIRLQNRSLKADRSWWHRRWIEWIEEMNMGPRLGRGKMYAISGQVVFIKVCPGEVVASVVGVRPEPYNVRIKARTLPEAAKRNIVSMLRREQMLFARILAGELPMKVERLFCDNGLDLFPIGKLESGGYDMEFSCSCPDWSNPCKHTCAVLLILGEEIARRPMALLELRGIEIKDICDED